MPGTSSAVSIHRFHTDAVLVLPVKQKRGYFTLTMYYHEHLQAKERNHTQA